MSINCCSTVQTLKVSTQCVWRGFSVELTVQWAMTVHTKETQAEKKECTQKRKSGTQVKCRINSRWQQKGRWGREALTLGHPGMMTLFQILGAELRNHLDIYKHFQGWPETQNPPIPQKSCSSLKGQLLLNIRALEFPHLVFLQLVQN